MKNVLKVTGGIRNVATGQEFDWNDTPDKQVAADCSKLGGVEYGTHWQFGGDVPLEEGSIVVADGPMVTMRFVGVEAVKRMLRHFALIATFRPAHGDDVWGELEKSLREMPAAEVGRWFIDYILESAHQGFDGFSPRDMTGIRNLVRDMLLHREASLADDPEYFARKWSNGSHTW